MTKADQIRLQAWRFRMLQRAAAHGQCVADVPAFRHFPEDLLQVEGAV